MNKFCVVGAVMFSLATIQAHATSAAIPGSGAEREIYDPRGDVHIQVQNPDDASDIEEVSVNDLGGCVFNAVKCGFNRVYCFDKASGRGVCLYDGS